MSSGKQMDAFLPEVFVQTTTLGKPTGRVWINGNALEGVDNITVKSEPGKAAKVTVRLEVDVVRYGPKRPQQIRCPDASAARTSDRSKGGVH